jgi:hypothetical protein
MAEADYAKGAGEAGSCGRLWLGMRLCCGAAVAAGLIAGTVFLALEIATAYAFGAGTPFGPAHVTLHGLVGGEGLPEQLDPGLVAAGIFLHYVLSVFVTIPLAVLLHPWRNMPLVVAVSGVFGCLLYAINFNLFTPVLPMLSEARDVFMLVDYTVFGMVSAWSYKAIQHHLAREDRGQASWRVGTAGL